MKFLNEIDGAKRVKQDSNNRFVTDEEKQEWNNKAEKTDIPTKLPADGGNADTVNGFTVDTNVPANAKFTDTVTTINGKTGAISKADIVALGIPAQDTIYTHPSTHPASMIIESSDRRFVSDAKISEWDSKETTTGSQAKADQAEQNAKDYVDSKLADFDGGSGMFAFEIVNGDLILIYPDEDTVVPNFHIDNDGNLIYTI